MDGMGYVLLKGLGPLIIGFIIMAKSSIKVKRMRKISLVLFVIFLIIYLIGINQYGSDIWKPISEVQYNSNQYKYSRLLIIPVFFTFIMSFDNLSKLFVVFVPSLFLIFLLPDKFLFELFYLSFKNEIMSMFILPLSTLVVAFSFESPDKNTLENDDENSKKVIEESNLKERKEYIRISLIIFFINLLFIYIFLKTNDYVLLPKDLIFDSVFGPVRRYFPESILLVIVLYFALLFINKRLEKRKINRFFRFLHWSLNIGFFIFMMIGIFSIRVRQVPDFANTVDTFNLVEKEMLDSEDALIYNGIKDGREVVFIEMYRDMDLIVWNYQQYKNGEDFIKTYVYNKNVIYFCPGDYDYTYYDIGLTLDYRDTLAYYKAGEVNINHPYIYQGE